MIGLWQEFVHESCNKYSKQFFESEKSKAIAPIISEIYGKKRLKTVIVVNYGSDYFLVTAKHCIDSKETQTLFLQGFEKIDVSTLDWIVGDDDDGSESQLDFAIARLNVLSKEKILLANQSFSLPDFKTLSRINALEPQHFMLIGFPNAKNKLNNASEKKLKPYSISLINKQEGVGGKFIDCEFDRRKFYQQNKVPVQNIWKPDGMSGGPLLHLNTTDAVARDEEATFELSGLFIEYLETQKIVRSINILTIRNVIEAILR